jgi:hypothetical protein
MLENTPIAVPAPSRQLEGTRSNSACIAIKANRSILFVDPAEVVTVEAQGNYVLLSAVSGSGFFFENPYPTSRRNSCPADLSVFIVPRKSTLHSSKKSIRVPRPSMLSGSEEEENSMFRIPTKRICHFITPLWLGTDGFIDD